MTVQMNETLAVTPLRTAQEWLQVLEHRHKQEMQLGLTRIKTVAERLGLLKPTPVVLTVAGTNGKGSTVAALESIYRTAGYQVGVYSSPHLLVFNERIRINGIPVTDAELVNAFEAIEAARESILITYFEAATLAALIAFQQRPLDVMILEVGIGGRLDATNIINSDLSLITTVDFDHQETLGYTLEQIGDEKAGIMRANKPFVYADFNPPQTVRARAQTLSCPTYILGEQFSMTRELGHYFFSSASAELALPDLQLNSHALAGALATVYFLQDRLPVSNTQISEGAERATLAGRLQWIKSDRHTLLIDVAHNAQSVQLLARSIPSDQFRRIHAVWGALGDKDLDAMVAPMVHLVTNWYPAQLPGKRAATKKQVEDVLNRYLFNHYFWHNSACDAYWAACEAASPDDLIVVYGSFLTAGAVLQCLQAPQQTEE